MYEISLPHGTITRFPAAGVNKNALILCPGGGYEHCSIREGAPAGRAFARRGIETFVLRYDCAPAPLGTRPLAALSAAVQWVRAHAEQYGISPQRIAVGGFSAGAHLAGLHAAVWNRASWYPQGTDLALHQPNAAFIQGLCHLHALFSTHAAHNGDDLLLQNPFFLKLSDNLMYLFLG